ncbi:unnamed protein product [Phytomonas sp. Hart1]|nr:unnamed protein product [Phytomonas sp. Hart1]|eukprot:CCW71217.1 unnamed protein product [Phytomonas sp. isolate Hart1]
MFRRASYLLNFTRVISKTSYVSIFPIHLDPPTLQHREIFKLLLGMHEEPLNEPNISKTSLSSSNEALVRLDDTLKTASEVNLPSADSISHSPSLHSCSANAKMNDPSQRRQQRHRRPSSPLMEPKYAYMEPFARSIRNHSQLAPFENLILVPNTRYPISLAQSTNLAALTVLAVRGLPRVHVDFTALEHPDAGMPIIYDLTQRYPNCVLVHWLHDAYEMQRWNNFSSIKLKVPLMLLNTISLPVSMSVKPSYLVSNDYDRRDWMERCFNPKGDARGRQVRDPNTWPPDESSTIGQDPKEACAYNDIGKTKQLLKENSTLSSNLKNSKDIVGKDIERIRTTTNKNSTNRGEWWLTKSNCNDDNIEVSKSYYNSGSFSWLGVTHHMNSMVGWDNIDMVNIDPHYYTYGPYSCEHGILKSATNSSHLKSHKGPNIRDNREINSVVGRKDILISSDGFVKIVDEDFKINNRGASHAAVSTSKDTVEENTTDNREENLGASVWDLILLKIPSSSLTSSTPTFSALKELEQVKRGLRDILSALVLSSSPEKFQLFEESNVTKMRGILKYQNASSTANEGAQLMETNGWDALGDNKSSEHHERPEQLRLVPFQNAQRNVRELLEDIYQPLNYHQSYNHAMVTSPTGPCTQPQQPVGSRKSDTHPCDGNSAAKGNLFTDFETSESTQMDHSRVSEEEFAGGPIDPSSANRIICGHDTLSSTVVSQRLPVVEVHSVIRTTGADVRQSLWGQEINPIHILSDCVLRYIDSYMLYRDPRKSKANVDLRQSQPGLPSLDFIGTSPAARSKHMGSSDVRSVGGTRRLPLSKTGSCLYSSHRNSTKIFFENIIPRLELHYDKNNPIARDKYDALKIFQVLKGEEPDLIVPIGGDGYMMHCIRKNWRRFIPFYGVNAGHVGHLLNDCSALEDLFSSPLMMNSTNMLYCQAERETKDSEHILLSEMAFNDAWVERSSGQSAFIRILVNGEERIKGLRADGVLVSTAAGSTAYSSAVGASPIPVGSPLIQVVGSNVVAPSHWRPVHLNQEDVVEFEVLDHVKRPCRCFVDSVNLGNILRMQVRSSRVAGVTLAFSNSCDLQEKLFQMQFPKID